MNPLVDILNRAKAHPKHIVLAEGDDPRIVEGALEAARAGLAEVTLLRSSSEAIGNGASVINPAQSSKLQSYADAYYELRKHKDVDQTAALEAVKKPLCYANMMVRLGDADGSVAGAVHTTSDVVRSALQIIGVDSDFDMISSFFLMIMDKAHHKTKGAVVFADSGLVISPDEKELQQIAITSAASAKLLLDVDPKIAMLSFATKDSAKHPHVDKVANVTQSLSQTFPDLIVDGPLQFDAAFVPTIAEKKAKGSPVAGQANIFIFPDLNSGNIAYKIAERIGGAKAIGPILQGLAKPANDLSRGCDAEAVFNMIAVTTLQAQ